MDPFNQSVSTLNMDPDEIRDTQQNGEPIPDIESSPSVNPGSLFVYDLETVPDETRYPRPAEVDRPARKMDVPGILRTADTVKAELASGLNPDQAIELLEEEQSGKARKTVIQSLRTYIDYGDAEMQAWKKLSVSPWQCRIVAMGIFHVRGEPEAWIARNRDEERELLSAFWVRHEGGRRSGYNIFGFDDLVIVARSIILGVHPGKPITLRKYGNTQGIDLMNLVCPAGTPPKLKDLAWSLGIVPPAGDVDGSMVLDMVDGGQWDQLEAYVRSDVVVEMALLRKLQAVVSL
jgi:hypothetical protein